MSEIILPPSSSGKFKSKKLWLYMGIAVVLAAVIYALIPSSPWSDRAQEAVAAPEFSFPDINGRSVSLSQFKGKVVLINFWATWCEPCREELPDLISLYGKYKDKGLVVLGVAMDASGAKVVAPFVADAHIPYPVLIGGEEPPSGYPIPGFPTSFLVDRKGLVVTRYLGPQSLSDFSQDVETVLGQP